MTVCTTGRRVAIVATALATGMTAFPSTARAQGYDQAQLQRDLNAVSATGVVGTLGEVVTPSGRLRARAGVRELTSRDPVPADARFRIGSVTKTFVSTVVLRLVGEGRLSLDDTVEKWLPGVVRGSGNDGRKITVRQLLQHTSGLHNYLPKPPGSARAWRRERLRSYRAEQLVARAVRHRPDFAPGTNWRYSNTNYVLAGMIIRKVTGHTWQREVHDRILKPLGLRHTSAPGVDTHMPKPHARAYMRFQRGGPLVDVTVKNQTLGDAAGGMISTTGDLNAFFRALMDGKLLAPAQLVEMEKTVPAKELQAMGVPGARYGLGLLYRPLSCGGGYWSHGGDGDGYRTRLGVTPDGRRGIVVSATSRSLADFKAEQRADQAMATLVDHALCATG
ncbi:serine hydrolase domain-containing protein [Nonomuraea sp. NPDC026600]|uniref:serine hydrolase domain-containing protein n=1 Tax=Nonomuraea sp. NPDC026600 TaxID=3155363 RepID=UPI0033E6C6E5